MSTRVVPADAGNWNLAETIYRLGASPIADRPALIHDEELVSYAELRRRSLSIASWLTAQGVGAGAHVGHYLRNSNAYMEVFFGAGLAGMSHVNVNYRYREQELIDLCRGLDIAVLVYDAEFADRVAAIARELADNTVFIEVGSGEVGNEFATSLIDIYRWDGAAFAPRTSPDDLILIATGGTTGLPKGVLWRNEDLWRKLNISTEHALKALQLEQHPATLAEHIDNVLKLEQPAPFMPLSPLMHGAGLFMALAMVAQGVALVTASGGGFDAAATLGMIARHQVGGLALVGDAFAIPLIRELERRPAEKLLASLRMMISTGASLSDDCKKGLYRHRPDLILFDTLGSSEAMGMAVSTPEAGVFRPLPNTRVLDDRMQEIRPGSEQIGLAFVSGNVPLGYYRDPEKSAQTFPVVDGVRYVNTGDRCLLRADGMLILLGRDSTVINTGGEKVYTVEVERVLIAHPDVSDALVIGLPHPRFGQMVVAVVQGANLSRETIARSGVFEHAGLQLADYKLPKHIFVIPDLGRAANGKPDYPFVTQFAESCLAGVA